MADDITGLSFLSHWIWGFGWPLNEQLRHSRFPSVATAFSSSRTKIGFSAPEQIPSVKKRCATFLKLFSGRQAIPTVSLLNLLIKIRPTSLEKGQFECTGQTDEKIASKFWKCLSVWGIDILETVTIGNQKLFIVFLRLFIACIQPCLPDGLLKLTASTFN